MSISERTEKLLLEYARESSEERKEARQALKEVSERLADVSAHLLVLDQRVGVVEIRVNSLDNHADKTGAQEKAKLEKQLAERETELKAVQASRRKAVTDWVIRFTAGVILLGLGSLLTFFLKWWTG